MFCVYETATGAILKCVDCPDFLLADNTPDGASAIFGDYDDTLYRVDLTSAPHVAVPKTQIDVEPQTTNVSQPVSIDLPLGTVVTVEGESVVVDATPLFFSVDYAGVYELKLTHALYLDTTLEITVE